MPTPAKKMPRPLRPWKPKTIGIVGSRRRNSGHDLKACLAAFEREYQPGDRIVSGGCPSGGDRFAELFAREMGLSIIIHHADWNGLGKSAGFQRNTKIAADADVLIAVVAADRTGGMEDTVRKAAQMGKRIVLV
jgi:hypothetical protein